ncbi:MAG: CDP-diacylglycerol--glycerol-3-phosphate 3-phosphatidyltransferase [Intestinibacillus sp.]
MTTANQITMVRIAMIPFFVYFAMQSSTGGLTAALALFCIASFTDFLDGYVARKYNQVTDFGKFVDPLADKLLVTAALLIFIEKGVFPAWMVFIILAREFIITSLRNVAAAKGRVLAAAWTGKVKTVVQIAGIILMFAMLIAAAMEAIPDVEQAAPAPMYLGIATLMTLVTLYSGFDYMVKNWDIVKEGAGKPKA